MCVGGEGKVTYLKLSAYSAPFFLPSGELSWKLPFPYLRMCRLFFPQKALGFFMTFGWAIFVANFSTFHLSSGKMEDRRKGYWGKKLRKSTNSREKKLEQKF
jgi:hypothetical protein